MSRKAAPLALGALDALVGWHLARAAVPATAVYQRHLGRPFDLSRAEFSLISLLAANPPLVPKQLAAALALSAPKLTLLLDRLQQRGMVERAPNPADGRSTHIVLTERGRRLARETAKAAATMEQALVARLSRAEQAMLVELLAKLTA